MREARYRYKEAGFVFRENKEQEYFETVANGITWLVLRTIPASYWVVLALRGKRVVPMNCMRTYSDGRVETDPLYHEYEVEDDVPEVLLKRVADYITSGADPFPTVP